MMGTGFYKSKVGYVKLAVTDDGSVLAITDKRGSYILEASELIKGIEDAILNTEQDEGYTDGT